MILPKISRYVKTFKVKDGKKDKSNNLYFCIGEEKLLEKYKSNWTEDLRLKKKEILNWILY